MSRRRLWRSPSRVGLVLAAALGLASTGWAGDLADLGPVPRGGLRVILLRHAQALSNLSPRPDLSPEELDHLTPLGREQAEAVGRALAPLEIDELLSSPAQRAVETTEIVGAALGIEGRIEQGVRPLELGRARDGSPLSWQTRQAAWEAGRDPRPPAGESLSRRRDRGSRGPLRGDRGLHRSRPGGTASRSPGRPRGQRIAERGGCRRLRWTDGEVPGPSSRRALIEARDRSGPGDPAGPWGKLRRVDGRAGAAPGPGGHWLLAA